MSYYQSHAEIPGGLSGTPILDDVLDAILLDHWTGCDCCWEGDEMEIAVLWLVHIQGIKDPMDSHTRASRHPPHSALSTVLLERVHWCKGTWIFTLLLPVALQLWAHVNSITAVYQQCLAAVTPTLLWYIFLSTKKLAIECALGFFWYW